MERGVEMGQEIRYLDTYEKMRSRDLWEEAFPEDSKSFDDYYFQEKLKDNRILVLEEAGRIDSMIHLNPYRVQVKNHRWRVDYLVGVATRKDRRHRGYMRRLLMRMMADMRAEDMPFCFLMPADEAIYRPFGFTYIYRQPQWQWKDVSPKDSAGATVRRDMDLRRDVTGLTRRALLPWKDSLGNRRYLEELAAWMNRWLANRYQVYAVRNVEYLLRLMKEITSEDGNFDVLYDGDDMVGMESRWGWGEKEQRLLYGEATYIQEKAAPKPAIMARIISVEPFMRAVCLKDSVVEDELTITLCLTDSLIAENEGVWTWHLNHESSWVERQAALPECELEQSEAMSGELRAAETHSGTVSFAVGTTAVLKPVLQLTVTELTGWLFGYQIPEAAEEYAEVVQTLEGVFLDEIV